MDYVLLLLFLDIDLIFFIDCNDSYTDLLEPFFQEFVQKISPIRREVHSFHVLHFPDSLLAG